MQCGESRPNAGIEAGCNLCGDWKILATNSGWPQSIPQARAGPQLRLPTPHWELMTLKPVISHVTHAASGRDDAVNHRRLLPLGSDAATCGAIQRHTASSSLVTPRAGARHPSSSAAATVGPIACRLAFPLQSDRPMWID